MSPYTDKSLSSVFSPGCLLVHHQLWLESCRAALGALAQSSCPAPAVVGTGTILHASSKYSPGSSVQLVHFSLELQNACCAFVKDISINANYAVLLCLYPRVKQNTLCLKCDFGNLLTYFTISPILPTRKLIMKGMFPDSTSALLQEPDLAGRADLFFTAFPQVCELTH